MQIEYYQKFSQLDARLFLYVLAQDTFFNTLRPRQNGRRFADDTFKRIFLNENVRISIKISLKCVPNGPINNIPALVQIMAWRRSGDKPLYEPMMGSSLTHICVTRPKWVKMISVATNPITKRCRYNAVNFLPNPHNKHSIARPCMGCLLWVEIMFFRCRPCYVACNIMTYWTALERYSTVSINICFVGLNMSMFTRNYHYQTNYLCITCLQAITSTNADILSVGRLGTNINVIVLRYNNFWIQENAFEYVACKMVTILSRP